MKDRLSIRLGVTKNLGDFNNFRADVEYGSDLREGETLEQLRQRVIKIADRMLDKLMEQKEEK